MFRRGTVYWVQDNQTGKQESLGTKDKAEAVALLHAKNESARKSVHNLQMARVYLAASDSQMATRTWQNVMDEIIHTKTGANQDRWITCAKSKQLDSLRSRVLIETQAEHLLHVLQKGTVSTNVYLRRMHNFALDMNWLPASIIPKRQCHATSFRTNVRRSSSSF